MSVRSRIILGGILAVVVTFVVGFLIGYFTRGNGNGKEETTQAGTTQEQMEAKHSEVVNEMDGESIEKFLRYFTKRPHIAASDRNYVLAKYIGDKFKEYGFDKVEYPKYNVLLSKIPKGESNVLELINTTTGQAEVHVSGLEPFKDPAENDTLVSPPFLGYSPNGTVEGELVYVNYGRIEDFQELNKTVNIKDKIAIMRFGKIYRGNKVQNAADFGAKAAILFNDPIDYAPLGVNETYPKTWFLPGSAAQRGTLFLGSGDPLTPGLPAVDGTFRLEEKDANLPPIPAHTLNYDEAQKFLKVMGGSQAPESWRGSLPGVKYNEGPGFTTNDLKVKLQVKTQYTREDAYNVIGTIRGREEPDRYVMLGNHRDSWVFGAVDPSSGTSVMLEIARGLGKLLKTGWRPRRTILFCSWGAEEYGLLGSYEWVEENAKLLNDRAVSYINIDIAVMGNYSFKASGTQLLKDLVYNEAKMIKDPNAYDDKKTVYDVWNARYPAKGSEKGKPSFGGLGAGSDYAPIYQFIGIPSVDMRYGFSSDNVTYYPVYHTMHDSFHWMKTFVDPVFVYHQTVAKVGSRILLKNADTPLLPFTFSSYGDKVLESMKSLEKNHGSKLENNNVTLTFLKEAVNKLNDATKAFDKRVNKLNEWSASFAELRMINDQMIQFERSFMEPAGLPGRPLLRHVVFAPSMHDSYGSSSFPGVTDVLFDIDKTKNWSEVKKQMSFLTAALHSAAKILEAVN